jgi:hypothetical protein
VALQPGGWARGKQLFTIKKKQVVRNEWALVKMAMNLRVP